ncbi:MAG: exosortase/archaeosortase family protein [Armatimonadetes bacterium]|nr:exosortase/archaeosortase family protein [Armatimonadota bacterium]
MSIVDPSPAAAQSPRAFDWQRVVRSDAFLPGLVFAAALGVLFWPLLAVLPELWQSEDGYYSHGWLVPLIAAYIVYRRWPQLSTIPVRPSAFALLPLATVLFLVYAGRAADLRLILSHGLIATLLCTVWFVAGWRWMLGLFWPIAYLYFALPIWTFAIDTYTAPLQRISSWIAFQMLHFMGFEVFMVDRTNVLVGDFNLFVGVPCSGFKLILAVTAFTVLFVLIANLRWWANLLMFAVVAPLCLFINGLRIALIGIVGDRLGSEAGHAFHNYSGYVTRILCFFLLFKLARVLGWKD